MIPRHQSPRDAELDANLQQFIRDRARPMFSVREYQQWAAENGERAEPANRIGRALKRLGCLRYGQVDPGDGRPNHIRYYGAPMTWTHPTLPDESEVETSPEFFQWVAGRRVKSQPARDFTLETRQILQSGLNAGAAGVARGACDEARAAWEEMTREWRAGPRDRTSHFETMIEALDDVVPDYVRHWAAANSERDVNTNGGIALTRPGWRARMKARSLSGKYSPMVPYGLTRHWCGLPVEENSIVVFTRSYRPLFRARFEKDIEKEIDLIVDIVRQHTLDIPRFVMGEPRTQDGEFWFFDDAVAFVRRPRLIGDILRHVAFRAMNIEPLWQGHDMAGETA